MIEVIYSPWPLFSSESLVIGIPTPLIVRLRGHNYIDPRTNTDC